MQPVFTIAEAEERINYSERLLSYLAIDTSQGYLSLALSLSGRRVSIHQEMPQKQSDTVLSAIHQLIAKVGLSPVDMRERLDYIAVGEGPGSFVGLRLAMSVAQGLSMAWHLPVVTVNNTALLAWQQRLLIQDIQALERITVAIDARMNQVYAASFCYQSTQQLLEESPVSLIEPSILSQRLVASDDQQPARRHWLVGNGFSAYESLQTVTSDSQQHYVVNEIYPEASAMGSYLVAHALLSDEIVDTLRSTVPVPTYIRDNVADKPAMPN